MLIAIIKNKHFHTT